MIEWLERAFGFEPVMVVQGENDTIAHAELKLGNGRIMLGSMRDDEFRTRSPKAVGGVTCGVYAYVEDVGGHYERARAAGAEIVRPLADTPYGSREYSARDPEGHLWHFGTYLPGAEDVGSQAK